MNSSRSAVIRFCIEGFLNHFEVNGGVVTLPSDWDKILKELDDRYHKQSFGTAGTSQLSEVKTQKAAEHPKSPYGSTGKEKKPKREKATKKPTKRGTTEPKPRSKKRARKKK